MSVSSGVKRRTRKTHDTTAGLQMAKREISAKAFVKDFRSGMNEAEFLDKYSLSRKKLSLILKKLVDAKALGRDEVDSWLAVSRLEGPSEDAVTNSEIPVTYSGPPRRLRVAQNHQPMAETAHAIDDTPSGPAGLETVKYRLKLYGRTSSDPEAFCSDLAAVLGIEPSIARDYLNRVPVSIKEGISQQKAERLRSVLASVGALCLLEPMDGEEQPPASPTAAKETSITEALLMRRGRTDEDAGLLPSNVRPSMIVLLGVLVILCVGGLYLMIATQSTREDIALNGPREITTARHSRPVRTVSDQEVIGRLEDEANDLKAKLPELKSRLEEEKAGFDLLLKAPGVTMDELHKKDSIVRDIQAQIIRIQSKINSFKNKARLLERHDALAEKTQPVSHTK
jgi:hypothetical protein